MHNIPCIMIRNAPAYLLRPTKSGFFIAHFAVLFAWARTECPDFFLELAVGAYEPFACNFVHVYFF